MSNTKDTITPPLCPRCSQPLQWILCQICPGHSLCAPCLTLYLHPSTTPKPPEVKQ